MTPQKRAQYHIPAALIAAAGVARLTMAEDEVVFDIPTLLDATLQFATRPAGPRSGPQGLGSTATSEKARKSPLMRLSRQL